MTRQVKVGLLTLVLAAALSLAGWVVPASPVQAQGTAQISSPRDRSEVRGLVPIEGSATHPNFQKYEVHYGPEPNPGDQWTPIGGSPFSVPVVQGRLGLWDTTVIPDGLYSLRLRVVRADGNYDEYFVRGVRVVNSRPVDTPTPAGPTDTPLPAGPTAIPTPTPTIVIGVPTVLSPTPRATATRAPTATPEPTRVPMDLPFQNVSGAACWGVGVTTALFVGVGLLFALKSSIAALARWLARRGRESLGMFEE
jgi:hypothetical protein